VRHKVLAFYPLFPRPDVKPRGIAGRRRARAVGGKEVFDASQGVGGQFQHLFQTRPYFFAALVIIESFETRDLSIDHTQPTEHPQDPHPAPQREVEVWKIN
jgi:hypothetical protein